MNGTTITILDTAKCSVCGKDKKDTHWLNGKKNGIAICNKCESARKPYQPPQLFDEQMLRAAIVSQWGEHGAHVDLYDSILKMLKRRTYMLKNIKTRVDSATIQRLIDKELANPFGKR